MKLETSTLLAISKCFFISFIAILDRHIFVSFEFILDIVSWSGGLRWVVVGDTLIQKLNNNKHDKALDKPENIGGQKI